MTCALPDSTVLLGMWDALAGLRPGERLFRTRRLQPPLVLDVRVGLREGDEAPCLIVVVDEIGAAMVTTFEARGLRLGRARDDDRLLLVLSLEEAEGRDLFAYVCADVIRAVGEEDAATGDSPLRTFGARLDAWRAFLRDRSAEMQRHEAVGLAGELILLSRLMAAGLDGLAFYRAPDDGLHDFEHGGWALEVKASLGAGSRLQVSSLDQLDDRGVAELNLVHVRFVEDPAGDGIAALADRLVAAMPTERHRRTLRNALLRRGLPPEADRTLQPFLRLVDVDYYRVAAGFPRLCRRDVPPGIAEAGYQLEVRGLAPYLMTEADAFAGLERHG